MQVAARLRELGDSGAIAAMDAKVCMWCTEQMHCSCAYNQLRDRYHSWFDPSIGATPCSSAAGWRRLLRGPIMQRNSVRCSWVQAAVVELLDQLLANLSVRWRARCSTRVSTLLWRHFMVSGTDDTTHQQTRQNMSYPCSSRVRIFCFAIEVLLCCATTPYGVAGSGQHHRSVISRVLC
jgi:hypothetical protein